MQKIAIKQEATFFKDDQNCSQPIVRMSSIVMSNNTIKRNDWVSIQSRTSKKTIFRLARGYNSTCLPADAIMVGYDDCIALEPDRNKQQKKCTGSATHMTDSEPSSNLWSVDWVVRKANFIERLRAYWSYPDRGYRISMQIAIMGLIVGVLGFITGILGVVF